MSVVEKDNVQTIDSDSLSADPESLDEIDLGSSDRELIDKIQDPIGYCLKHQPTSAGQCLPELERSSTALVPPGAITEVLEDKDYIRDIYFETIRLSEDLFSTWSISILAVALAVRVIYELSKLSSGRIEMEKLGADIVVYSLLTGGYVLIVQLIVSLYLDISSYFSSEVLLDKLQNYLGTLRQKLEERVEDDAGLFEMIQYSWTEYALSSLTTLISFFIKIFQYFILIAHGILFTIIVMFGSIVIPVSLAGYVNLLAGWLRMVAVVVLYPIIQALMFWALLRYFSNNGLLTLDDDAATVQSFELFFVENLVNLSVVAIFIIAPFATNAVVSGSGNLSGVLMPMYLSGAYLSRQAAQAATSISSGLRDIAMNKHLSRVKDVFKRPETPPESYEPSDSHRGGGAGGDESMSAEASEQWRQNSPVDDQGPGEQPLAQTSPDATRLDRPREGSEASSATDRPTFTHSTTSLTEMDRPRQSIHYPTAITDTDQLGSSTIRLRDIIPDSRSDPPRVNVVDANQPKNAPQSQEGSSETARRSITNEGLAGEPATFDEDDPTQNG